MKVAEPLSSALNEMKGYPRYKITKLGDLVGVYNKRASTGNFKYLFSDADTILRHRLKFKEDCIVIDDTEYKGEYIIEQLITLCKLHDIDLYWDTEVLIEKIFTK